MLNTWIVEVVNSLNVLAHWAEWALTNLGPPAETLCSFMSGSLCSPRRLVDVSAPYNMLPHISSRVLTYTNITNFTWFSFFSLRCFFIPLINSLWMGVVPPTPWPSSPMCGTVDTRCKPVFMNLWIVLHCNKPFHRTAYHCVHSTRCRWCCCWQT